MSMWVKKEQVSNSGRMVGSARFDRSAAPSATTAFCAHRTAGVGGCVEEPPRPARADSGCDGDQGGRFEPFVSCGEDRRRKGDELRQFPSILGGGG